MKLLIRFEPAGFFLNDAKVALSLNGEPLLEGSFSRGFRVETEAPEGEHVLEAQIHAGFIVRKKEWTFRVPREEEGSARFLDVRLSYSRTWGTFARELDIRELDIAEWDALAAEPEEAPSVFGDAKERVIATWALLASLIVVFFSELVFSIRPAEGLSPAIETLIGLGGLFRAKVFEGEWFRLVSSTFLHVNFVHILFNGVALAMVGSLLESLIGWRWFLAVYFVGGLGGALASLALNDGTLVSVGASGAIMGLFAAGLFIVHVLGQAEREQIRFQLLRVLVPSLLPILPTRGMRVDFGAHLGGALAGALVGAVLLAALRSKLTDERGIARFRASPVALALASLFAIGASASFAGVAFSSYPTARAVSAVVERLAPDDVILPVEPQARPIAAWLERYPDDPRVQLFAAAAALDEEHLDQARRYLEQARIAWSAAESAFPQESIATLEGEMHQLEESISLLSQLLPNRDLPTGTTERVREVWSARLSDWLAQYPDDPRVRVQAAYHAMELEEFERAEEHARAAIGNAARFASVFPDGIDVAGEMTLLRAEALVALDRNEEAQPLFRSICEGAHGSEIRDFAARYCQE